MTRRQLRTIHLSGAIIAQVVVGIFLIAAVVAEVSGDEAIIAGVKGTVARFVFVLAPVMIVTGLSGRSLAGESRAEIVVRKMRRMRLIGLNALVVLVPCAMALGRLAADRNFGTWFIALQSVELMAGCVNFTLLALNVRDGLALRPRRRRLRPREVGSEA
ncbi:MAG: hypothetical protein M3124_07420 [Actinomycetota bacterium]|nr:hypothetical protein [Actinomycetota bacterium]